MGLLPRRSLFDFDHFFDAFGVPNQLQSSSEQVWSPRIDIHEQDDRYMISAELPGVKKEDLKVTLDNGILTIDAESHQEDKEEKDGRIIRQERRYGRFTRSFDLGNDVQQSDIEANFADGVLKLSAPKQSPEANNKQTIDVT